MSPAGLTHLLKFIRRNMVWPDLSGMFFILSLLRGQSHFKPASPFTVKNAFRKLVSVMHSKIGLTVCKSVVGSRDQNLGKLTQWTSSLFLHDTINWHVLSLAAITQWRHTAQHPTFRRKEPLSPNRSFPTICISAELCCNFPSLHLADALLFKLLWK